MEENKQRSRDALLAEAMQVLDETRKKIAKEHPLLFMRMQRLAAEAQNNQEPENLQTKNKITVMKYLKLRKFKSQNS